MCHGQLISEAMHRARKEHRCVACNSLISPGQEYVRQSSVDGRHHDFVKICVRCRIMVQAANEFNEDGCSLVPEEDVREGAISNWRAVRKLLRKAQEYVNENLRKKHK